MQINSINVKNNVSVVKNNVSVVKNKNATAQKQILPKNQNIDTSRVNIENIKAYNPNINFSGHIKYPTEKLNKILEDGVDEVLQKETLQEKVLCFYDLLAKRQTAKVDSLRQQHNKKASENFKELIGDIEHEEGNIYKDILTQGLKNEISSEKLDEGIIDTIKNLHKSSQRAQFLYDHGESNKTPLGKVLDLAIESVDHRIKDKKLNVTVEKAELIEKLKGKKPVIENYMIFSNLIGNAAKYTPKNGKIEIKLAKNKNKVLFSVSDNGIGIPKGQIEDVRKGIRAQNAIELGINGTGHGLQRVDKAISEQGKKYTLDIQSPPPKKTSGTEITAPIKLSFWSRFKKD